MIRYSWLYVLFFLLSTTIQAQLLTIGDAVEQAIQNNAYINQVRSELQQKEHEWRTLTGVEAPEISYFKEGMNGNTAKPFEEKRLTISQSVDFPLTIAYRMKALAKEKEALEQKIRSEEKEIKAKVKSSYISVMFAIHQQKLRKQQLKLAEDLYNAVYTRFETGVGNGIDLTKAELQVAESKNDLDDSKRMLHEARYSLFNLMGLSPEEQKYSIQFMDTLQTNPIEVSQLQALEVVTDQPLYLAAQKELDASTFSLKEARSNILPDIRFNVYKQNYGDGYHFNGFELGLSFPIWYPFEQKGKIEIALARQDQIRWRQKEIKLDTKKQIETAWHGYETSLATIKRYNETIHSKAEKLKNLTLEAYRLGEVDLLNLINAQQIYLSSQQRYLSALQDFYIQQVALEKYLQTDLVY